MVSADESDWSWRGALAPRSRLNLLLTLCNNKPQHESLKLSTLRIANFPSPPFFKHALIRHTRHKSSDSENSVLCPSKTSSPSVCQPHYVTPTLLAGTNPTHLCVDKDRTSFVCLLGTAAALACAFGRGSIVQTWHTCVTDIFLADPFAEADEDTGETKQSQNYIHIRIQRTLSLAQSAALYHMLHHCRTNAG